MKMRSARIKIVVELAQRQSDKAATEFQKAQKELENEMGRLMELEEYYSGYQNHFAGNGAPMRASDLQKSRLFLQQIAEAITSQQQQIVRVESLVDQRRAAWHSSHLKYKSLVELCERYRNEEAVVLDKKEQRLLDEWFNQMSGRK